MGSELGWASADPGRDRSLIAWLAPGVAAAHHSYPAVYTGTAATGGTIELHVTDAAALDSVSFQDVPTTCGPANGGVFGSLAVDSLHGFSANGSSPGRWSGPCRARSTPTARLTAV